MKEQFRKRRHFTVENLNDFADKWSKMTPDEKVDFVASPKQFFGGKHFRSHGHMHRGHGHRPAFRRKWGGHEKSIIIKILS